MRIITDVLELAGALLLVAALFVLAAAWSLPAALAASGIALIGVSWAFTRAGRVAP